MTEKDREVQAETEETVQQPPSMVLNVEISTFKKYKF
jgi:hypothetical protein